MIDFAHFYQLIAKNRLSHWLHTLPAQLHAWQHDNLHGDLPRWNRALAKLPVVAPGRIELKERVAIGGPDSLGEGERKKTESLLRQLMPWRKGPFHVHGIHIDTEWRSDWKWDRVLPHISPLQGRYVLDVGCGSGYHLWRMVGEGAKLAVGIDPSPLFLCQFEA
ncbi:TPA: tRNA 5-methoxyuridine(34)/uridine 5-oxyacetic acid(34) synthase CmoB, partial [Klebsiella pneumoniae]